MKKNKTTAQDVIAVMPEPFQAIAYQSFVMDGRRVKVLVRVKPEGKSPLYLFDMDGNAFISSLYWKPAEKRFFFETKTKGADGRNYFSMDTAGNIKPEAHGYYPTPAELNSYTAGLREKK